MDSTIISFDNKLFTIGLLTQTISLIVLLITIIFFILLIILLIILLKKLIKNKKLKNKIYDETINDNS